MIESLMIGALAAFLWMLKGGMWYDRLPAWYRNPFSGKKLSLKIPATSLVAFLYVLIIGYNPWCLIFVAWLPLMTQINGTGDYMGKMARGHAVYPKDGTGWEKFQWTGNAWWTGAAAGAIWTFPCLWFGWLIDPDWYLVALANTISVPMAGILSRKLFDEDENRWRATEGLLAGIAMLIVSLAVSPSTQFLHQ
jgi:hypothetical protein